MLDIEELKTVGLSFPELCASQGANREKHWSAGQVFFSYMLVCIPGAFLLYGMPDEKRFYRYQPHLPDVLSTPTLLQTRE